MDQHFGYLIDDMTADRNIIHCTGTNRTTQQLEQSAGITF
jgi:hypothetical protein